jgi:hypothetical protein
MVAGINRDILTEQNASGGQSTVRLQQLQTVLQQALMEEDIIYRLVNYIEHVDSG